MFLYEVVLCIWIVVLGENKKQGDVNLVVISED